MSRRLLLVGWDAADWQIIHPLVDAGKMPVLQRLIENGTTGRLASLEPMVSPLLWTSIATGKRAYGHGIYSFTATERESGRVESVGSGHRTSHALWNILHHEGKRSVVCNWFASHPAEAVDGLVVSNEFAAQARHTLPQGFASAAVSPAKHWEELQALRIHPEEIDGSIIKLLVPRAEEIDQEHDSRLARLASLLAENFNVHSAFTYGLEVVPWDFAAVYYEAIDLAAHYFMRYVAPAMPGVPRLDAELYGQVVEGIYRLHDAMLGRLLQLAGPVTTTLIVSDHGFHSKEGRPGELPDIPLALTRWHRRQGVFIMHGPEVRRDELIYGAGLLDIAPTILTFFNLPVGQDMEGRVLTEAFVERPHVAVIPSWEELEGDFGRIQPGVRKAQSSHLLQRFIDLGYLSPATGHDLTQASSQYCSEQFFRALALLDGQRVAEALPILDELHELEPERDDIAQVLASVLLRCGLIEEAKELIDLLDATAPGLAALQSRADMAFQIGDRSACFNVLELVEKSADRSVQALNLAGSLYVQLREISRAEAVFTRSLEIEKENPSALAGLSYCRSLQGRYEEAAELALEGISLLFNHFYSHFCYGVATIHLGQHDKALRAFENTLRFQPRFHRARRYLIHLLRSQPSAKEQVDLHRSILLQRGIDDVRKDFERRGLREALLAGRKERAQARERTRAEAGGPLKAAVMPEDAEILIVSGLPRSGTSLVMQMLEAAGVPILTDHRRTKDEDNPQGYYEWEPVKSLPENPHIIAMAFGRAVKVVSPLLPALPRKYRYRVAFVRRDLGEAIASQDRMRHRLTGTEPENPASTHAQLTEHLEQTFRLLRSAPNVDWIEISFERLLAKCDTEMKRLADYFKIDEASLPAMRSVVRSP